MKLRILLSTVVLAGAVAQAADNQADRTSNATAAFSRLKTLVGEWEADTSLGKARLTYELMAGGTTLVEHYSAEKTATMLTVYHMDGDRLVLTHYCQAGNQPRMRAGAFNPETGELEFHFLDATNLSPGAGHMHSARMRLTDRTHLSTEWQFFEKGAPKFTETAQYTRVK